MKILLRSLFTALTLTAVAASPTVMAKETNTLVRDGYNQATMDAAIARARKEVDKFIAELNKGDSDSYSVKAPITDKNGTEHFWLVDISYKDGVFTGNIGNQPGIVRNVKAGQAWRVKREDISDWMYTRGEKIHGGYTVDPLLAAMPKREAAAMKARLVR